MATIGLGIGFFISQGANAATIVVNSSLDSGAACTLRKAIQTINDPANPQTGCAQKPGSPVFGLDDRVEFTSNVSKVLLQQGGLEILRSIGIDGGDSKVEVNGAKSSGVFTVLSPPSPFARTTATFRNLKITEGAAGVGAGVRCVECGLIILDSTVSGNSTTNLGGGIYASGEGVYLKIKRSVVSNNIAGDLDNPRFAAGIFIGVRPSTNNQIFIELDQVTVSNNTSGAGAGITVFESGVGPENCVFNLSNSQITGNSSEGLLLNSSCKANIHRSSIERNKGTGVVIASSTLGARSKAAKISDSTIANNTADDLGGGIFFNTEGTPLVISNTTISNNTAPVQGGGVFVQTRRLGELVGLVTLENSTISQNSLTSANSSVVSNLYSDYVSVTLRNTIIANATGGSLDCGFVAPVPLIANDSSSIIEDGSCSGGAIAGDPSLLPLGRNGGPTKTHALAKDSIALNMGDPSTCLAKDQRGESRDDARCDIGAYELVNRGFYVIKTKNDKVVVVPE